MYAPGARNNPKIGWREGAATKTKRVLGLPFRAHPDAPWRPRQHGVLHAGDAREPCARDVPQLHFCSHQYALKRFRAANRNGRLEKIIRSPPILSYMIASILFLSCSAGASRGRGRRTAGRIRIVWATRGIWIIGPARWSWIIWTIRRRRVVRIGRRCRVIRSTWGRRNIRAVWAIWIRIFGSRTFSILRLPRLSRTVARRIRPVGIVWRIVRAIRIVRTRIAGLLRILNASRA